jgi:hypothetical protein
MSRIKKRSRKCGLNGIDGKFVKIKFVRGNKTKNHNLKIQDPADLETLIIAIFQLFL